MTTSKPSLDLLTELTDEHVLGALIEERTPDFAVVDLKLAQGSGLPCVEQLHAHDPGTAIIVLTGYASIATAVQAIKLGATSYLAKPANTDEIEREFGRRPGGQRWAARVLDLDVVLWSGGCFAAPDLIIPHLQFRDRAFVLGPAAAIAPRWRDPVTGLTIRQLRARLARRAMLQARIGA